MGDPGPPRKAKGIPPRADDDTPPDKPEDSQPSTEHRDSVAPVEADSDEQAKDSEGPNASAGAAPPRAPEQDVDTAGTSTRTSTDSSSSSSLQRLSALISDRLPSGLQTPAMCRPLTRRPVPYRRATSGNRSRPAPPVWTQSDSQIDSRLRRCRSHETMQRLEQLRDSLPEPTRNATQASPEVPHATPARPTVHFAPPQSESAVEHSKQPQPRPPPPRRRISQQALQDTHRLRAELEDLAQQFSGEEASKAREKLAVQFAVNRIFEMQHNQMRHQAALIERFNQMDLQRGSQQASSGGHSAGVGGHGTANNQSQPQQSNRPQQPDQQQQGGPSQQPRRREGERGEGEDEDTEDYRDPIRRKHCNPQ